MNLKNILAHEEKDLKKLENLKLLPNRVKTIGINLLILSVILLFAGKFLFTEYHTVRLVIKNLILISLLLISVSRNKFEDERTLRLRVQSYAFAFITGVLYAMVQPFAILLVKSILQSELATLVELSVFQVLIFMLLVQISYFNFTMRHR